MLSVTATRDIPAPPEEIWTTLCDTSGYAAWIVGTEAVTRTDGPARLGGTYDEVNPVVGPWKTRSHWRVSEYDEGRSMVHVCDEFPMAEEFQVRMQVAPSPSGARVTITLEGETRCGPVGWLFARALIPRVRKDNEQTLVNLAQRLAAR